VSSKMFELDTRYSILDTRHSMLDTPPEGSPLRSTMLDARRRVVVSRLPRRHEGEKGVRAQEHKNRGRKRGFYAQRAEIAAAFFFSKISVSFLHSV
jgi:hypothetical protein